MKKTDRRKMIASGVIAFMLLLCSGIGIIHGNDEEIGDFRNIAGLNFVNDSALTVDVNIPETVNIYKEKEDAVVIKADVEKQLKVKNGTKNIRNYKRLCAEFDVPAGYRTVLDSYIENGYSAYDVFTAYEFLHDRFGTLDDFKDILEQAASGKAWEDIFADFNKVYSEYVPTEYEIEVLDEIFAHKDITVDQVKIAEFLAYRGLIDFDEHIGRRKEGVSFQEIAEEIGLLNVSGAVQSVMVLEEEVKHCVEELNMSEGEAFARLAAVKTSNAPMKKTMEYVRSGKSGEKIMKEYFDEKN